MYAIIETGGKQYRVEPGQIVEVELLDAPEGKVTFNKVMLCADGEKVQIGTPTLANAEVTGELIDEIKTKKVVGLKLRRRKDSKVKHGHRQNLARVRIDKITVN